MYVVYLEEVGAAHANSTTLLPPRYSQRLLVAELGPNGPQEKLRSCGGKRQDIGQKLYRDPDSTNGRIKAKRNLTARQRPRSIASTQIPDLVAQCLKKYPKQCNVRVRWKSPRETRKSRRNVEVLKLAAVEALRNQRIPCPETTSTNLKVFPHALVLVYC